MGLETNNDGQVQQQPPPRENLVTTAAAFLRNPAVKKTAYSRQEAFLKNKGLTDEEVALAFQQASMHDGYYPQQISSPHTSVMIPAHLPILSPWSRFRDVGNTVALLAGLVYAVYVFYKRYIAQYLFKTARLKSKEELLIELKTELLKSVDDLKCDLGRVSAKLLVVQQQQESSAQGVDMSDDLRNLKAEVASLKALLLSRNQFPTAVINSPSIPAWQLQSQDEKASGESASGSSEPELMAKNGSSDSSVDVLRD